MILCFIDKTNYSFSESCSVIEKKSHEVKECIFPFQFSGQTFTRCTTQKDPEQKPWCSTKVDAEGNHVTAGGYWGHCGQDCEEDQVDDPRGEASFVEGEFNWTNV